MKIRHSIKDLIGLSNMMVWIGKYAAIILPLILCLIIPEPYQLLGYIITQIIVTIVFGFTYRHYSFKYYKDYVKESNNFINAFINGEDEVSTSDSDVEIFKHLCEDLIDDDMLSSRKDPIKSTHITIDVESQ